MTESFDDAIKALRHIARGNGNVLRIADRIVAAHERETKVEGVCGPITGELRAAMCQWGWVAEDGRVTFGNCAPPSIDAEQLLAIRGSGFDQLCDAIDAVHAQLERENESLKAELDRVLGEQDEGAIIPPILDMDDKPIHFGDVMVMDGDSELREVVGFYKEGFFAWLNGRYVPCTANLYRHAIPDTWERIIEDALDGYHDTDFDKLVARCKALAGDAE